MALLVVVIVGLFLLLGRKPTRGPRPEGGVLGLIWWVLWFVEVTAIVLVGLTLTDLGTLIGYVQIDKSHWELFCCFLRGDWIYPLLELCLRFSRLDLSPSRWGDLIIRDFSYLMWELFSFDPNKQYSLHPGNSRVFIDHGSWIEEKGLAMEDLGVEDLGVAGSAVDDLGVDDLGVEKKVVYLEDLSGWELFGLAMSIILTFIGDIIMGFLFSEFTPPKPLDPLDAPIRGVYNAYWGRVVSFGGFLGMCYLFFFC
jgi:hypothetical protein